MKIDEVRRNVFYQFPQWLLDEEYRYLSLRAKVMYMLLFDRRPLSLKNNWHDKNGNVFVYFTNKQFIEKLACDEKSVIKAKNELSDFGLLREVRQGRNQPNRLYIFGTGKNTGQELENFQPSKTENNNTESVRLIEPDDDVGASTLYSNSTIGRALRENGFKVYDSDIQMLQEFVGLHNMTFDMIHWALREAALQNARNTKYVLAILNNWKKLGFTSLEQVEEHERQRKQPKQEEYDGIGNIPEWSSMHPKNTNKPKKKRVDPEEIKRWLEEYDGQ